MADSAALEKGDEEGTRTASIPPADDGETETSSSILGQEAIAVYRINETRKSFYHAEEELYQAREEREEHEDQVRHLKRQLAQARSVARASQTQENKIKTKVETLKAQAKAQETALSEIRERGDSSNNGGTENGAAQILDIMGVHNKNKKEEGEELSGYEAECLHSIQKIRALMAGGKIDEARAAESTLVAWVNTSDYDEHARIPDPTSLGKPGFEVQKAMFVKPYSICSNEELEATIDYAKEHPEEVFPKQMININPEDDLPAFLAFALSMTGHSHYIRKDLPERINLQILNEIRQFALLLSKQQQQQQQQKTRGEKDEDDDEDDDDDYSYFMWRAIEPSLRKHQSKKRELNNKQLELPSERSAAIARFNNSEPHFRFDSPTAIQQTPTLTRALVHCELRKVPPYDHVLQEATPHPLVHELPRGIAHHRTADSGFCLHVDEDLMAVSGTREIHCRQVPAYVNLETAKNEDELKVKEDVGWCCLKRRRKGLFSECAADSARGLVWAATFTGTVQAFDKSRAVAAQLFFSQQEKMALNGYCGGRPFGIRRMGDCIVGSANTPRLSVWNIQRAMDDYESNGRTFPKSTRDDEDQGPPPSKVQKRVSSLATDEGFLPQHVQVEDNDSGFECGDIEWIGGSGLLVGAARNEEKEALSLRHVDLEKETVVGLYCGLNGPMSIQQQLCVDRFNSIFVSDNNASYVYDTRTYQPSITLQTGHHSGQILGVPGQAAAMTAFAFCHRDQEEIQCWDLRMPAYHAYSMWTGNNDVNSLFWHEPTASLLAATTSAHRISEGRYSSYRYGEPVPDEDCWEDTWPKRAVHDEEYFGDSELCYHYDHPSIIQYSFANGKPMYVESPR